MLVTGDNGRRRAEGSAAVLGNVQLAGLGEVKLGFGVEERFVVDLVGFDFDEARRWDLAAEVYDTEGRRGDDILVKVYGC